MKIILIPISLLFLVSTFCYSQEYSSTSELLDLLNQTRITFSFEYDTTEAAYDKSARGLPPNSNFFYQEVVNDRIELKKYVHSDNAARLHSLADASWSAGNMSEARKHYEEILVEEPNNSQIMTFIGQSYEDNKNPNFKKQEEWYLKAIANNHLDYMAHWFLADLYYFTGNYIQALKEIEIAFALNRYNKNIRDSFRRIATANNLEFTYWRFNLPYRILKKNSDTIAVFFGSTEALSYATCKAVWEFIPSHREKYDSLSQSILITEELECLRNIVLDATAKNSHVYSEDESIQKLVLTFEQKRVYQFIIFEIFMRKNPFILHLQQKEFLDSVVEYVDALYVEKGR